MIAKPPSGAQISAARFDVSEACPDQRKLILHYAAETRRFEIERFWQRSTFFWTFIGATLVAFAALYPGRSARLLTLLAAFGGLASLAWTLQNRGSKYWQEAWEQKVATVEFLVLGVRLFSNREFRRDKGLWGASEYSVSRLTIMVSDLTVGIWFVLAVTAMTLRHSYGDMTFGIVVVLVAICIGIAITKTVQTDWTDHSAKTP